MKAVGTSTVPNNQGTNWESNLHMETANYKYNVAVFTVGLSTLPTSLWSSRKPLTTNLYLGR